MLIAKETLEGTWFKKRIRREVSCHCWLFWPQVSGGLVPWFALGKRGGGMRRREGFDDVVLWALTFKGSPWKALLITTCDETSRTKTALQKITAWELWVNLKYNRRAHPRHLRPTPTYTTRSASNVDADVHTCVYCDKGFGLHQLRCVWRQLSHSNTHSNTHTELTNNQLNECGSVSFCLSHY